MFQVTIEDLVEQKILPFDLYNEKEEKLFSAGDVLTPGKFMQLKKVPEFYTDVEDFKEKMANAEDAPPEVIPDEPEEEINVTLPPEFAPEKHEKIVISDDFQMPEADDSVSYTLDDMDISNFSGALNKKAKIEPEFQMKIKSFHSYLLTALKTKKSLDTAQLYVHLKDRIISDIITKSDGINFYSELRLLGEYKNTHALNVSILSGLLAYRMGVKESILSDVILGALVHDLGKEKIPASILEQPVLTDKEQKIIQTHTKIGYQLLKEEFKFSENVSKIALEHHENSNGSGYPYGKSGEFIAKESQIVSVCNHFDNLISNKTNQKIHNCHEALKILLELGSKRFAADSLYTFVHMLSYNDTDPLEEMTI